MILRLRQLCCHPNLILVSKPLFCNLLYLVIHFFASPSYMKCQAEDYDDPTMLVSGESEKELARARKVMGSEWVVKLKRR
jgi:hypothetical protein